MVPFHISKLGSYVFVNELDLPKVAAAKAKFMNLNELKAPLGC